MRAFPLEGGGFLYDTADSEPPDSFIPCAFCGAEHAPDSFERGFRHNGVRSVLRVRVCSVCMTLRPYLRNSVWSQVALLMMLIAESRRDRA